MHENLELVDKLFFIYTLEHVIGILHILNFKTQIIFSYL